MQPYNTNGVRLGNSSQNSTKQPVSKKLTIKNFREKSIFPQNYIDSAWEKLRNAIEAIHNKTAVSNSFEELFQAVGNLCSSKQSVWLYDQLRKLCEVHMQLILPQFVEFSQDSLTFLKLFNVAWQDHCQQMVDDDPEHISTS
uniref:Cullin N-terminal domain-containing protein n=1 Tax=Romanomermis culicivorax TaxID=13658 RepID=A0A915HN47_ROMCU